MSSLYASAVPPEFSNLLQQFPLDSSAQSEIEDLIRSGLARLNEARVLPRDAVYQGAIADLKYFLEQAQTEALINGNTAIDLNTLAVVRLRIPHVWPFF